MMIVALLAARPQPAVGGETAPRRSTFTDRVEVSLVLLHASVLNKRGESILGLTTADFLLREDGVEQEISVFGNAMDQPIKVAFLLDVSGSMAVRGKFEEAKNAIRLFVEELQPWDQVALMIFADGSVAVERGFSTHREDFFRALEGLEAFGQTALRDALAYASTLMAGAVKGRAALVMVTDGVDNASSMSNFEAIQEARRVLVPIYAIGISDLPERMRVEQRPAAGGRSFFEVMGDFTRETGGALFPVFSPEEIDRAVGTVQERLRSQYLIGYRPEESGEERGFRRIDLATTKRKLRVITRRGYYVSP
jgi:Ca-activated chloride channel family protein